MNRPKTILALATAVALLATAAAAPAATAAVGLAPAREFAPRQLLLKVEGERRGRTLRLPARVGVREAARALRGNPQVEYAVPNYIATASATAAGAAAEPPVVIPNDPGTLGGPAEAATPLGDWTIKQWNFLDYEGTATPRLPLSPGGIDAVGAWQHLEAAGRPGARGITVAVLDTGVAYRSAGSRFRQSPDFTAKQFVPGYDFVDGDRMPLDENGHGTHVAGTIAEQTGNGIGLTGLAYRAKLMPVRVLDSHGRGDAADIARGIRFAVAHHAQVINMSFNFGCHKRVPTVDEALREAYAHGVVTVASAGNLGSESCVSEPATGPRVIGVGGTTEGGCLGYYSLAGTAIDVLAPGGGNPVGGCASISARPIYQVTLRPRTTDEFAIPSNYVGTSMAAAHVSGLAALVLASGVLGKQPTPQAGVEAVTRRIRATARSLNLPATQQGAGLIDAGKATDPAVP
ncbi:MAG TPA: S8 family serine peptidase [Solirubrobacterales bacterium]|nr:S8 family serine peptidase [Solirubrobacterales bacterium]